MPPGRPPKRCKFADAVGCAGMHPPWRCGVFGDNTPEERTRIIEDNRLCPFCLLHDRSEVCYSKANKTKPECKETECKGQHIHWLHEVLKGTLQAGKKNEGKVNVVKGREGWRTPEDAWMEEEEEEGEVHFLNMVQAEEVDSDVELMAEIERTEEAMDECFRRRAKRAGLMIEGPEDKPMDEEEMDQLSEKLGDGKGANAKRRKEIGEMQVETMEAEIEEVEEILRKRRGAVKRSGLGSLPLALTIFCLLGGKASAFTAYDCSNRSNVIESYSLLEPDACANSGKEGEVETTVYGEIMQIM